MHERRAPPIPTGSPSPLGSHLRSGGAGFSVFSHNANLVELLLYDHVDDDEPSRVIPLSPGENRTNDYWHAFVPGVGAGQIYAYRAQGPYIPERGLRFDRHKVLLDPYGRAVATPKDYDRGAACRPGRNDRHAMKSVLVESRGYDWEGDVPLRRPFSQTVIYEMHVRGFTAHPSSGVAEDMRGTYAGLVEKIPYLVDLGVTAVELLPVFQFDPQEAPPGRTNYWGYAPMSFFAPHNGYSSTDDPLGVLNEFREMVKALHRAGLEVIIDVVYNHTAEGNGDGPTFGLKGLDNGLYYMLENSGATYANHSGTGNVLNANHAVVRRLVRDSLHYWVQVMHVDGFRFDLASILSRDEDGRPMPNAPLLRDIDTDPILAGTKLIVEAWDAGGLHQVGHFTGDYWNEWNGHFRDDVRAFVRGDEGCVYRVAQRLAGSPDLYGKKRREAEQSINFVTAHDGFTLNDLVTYERKHNWANGHQNTDGSNHNLSRNYGVEGPTDDPEIERIRERQIRNMLAITLLSLGAPMITMGDEVRRTQKGNNNPYCQDNEISWFDWELVEMHADLRRFVRLLIHFLQLRDEVRRGGRTPLAELSQRAHIAFHGVRLGEPDWGSWSHSLAVSATTLSGAVHMYYAANMWTEPLEFELPPTPPGGTPWLRVIDTSLPSPDDIAESVNVAAPVQADYYRIAERSLVALVTLAPTPTPATES